MTRTRFSIDTNKKLTLNDLRNLLFSYLIAKHDDGEFILRLDNSNQKHYHLENEEFFYKVIQFLGIEYDEGPRKSGEYAPYSQKERLNLYKSYAEKLVKRDKAYFCFCTKEELNRKRMLAQEKNSSYLYDGTCRTFPKDEARRKILIEEEYVIREKIPKEGQTSFHDKVYGDITFKNQVLDDQILIKSNGIPTYNFADILDNALMNITHITNDSTFLSSTPKSILLYESFGFPMPDFYHFPKLVGEKEDTLSDLLEQGFLKEAIINYLVLTSWTPKENREYFTLEELIHEFDGTRISKRPSCFDLQKLKWLNRHYIQEMKDDEYLKYVRPYLENFYSLEGKDESWIEDLLFAFKNKISFASEIILYTSLFFRSELEIDREMDDVKKETQELVVNLFKIEIENISIWTKENIKIALENILRKSGFLKQQVYRLIRVLLMGVKAGINLTDTIYLLGKDKVLERVGKII